MQDANTPSLLSAEVLSLIQKKSDKTHSIVLGALYVFFKIHMRFPETADVPLLINEINFVCIFLNIKIRNHHPIIKKCLDDQQRTIKRYKQEIRALFGFRLGTAADKNALIFYAKNTIFPTAPKWNEAQAHALKYLQIQKCEPFPDKQLNRLLTTAHAQFESELFLKIDHALDSKTKNALDALLTEELLDLSETNSSMTPIISLTLTKLKEDNAQLKNNSVLEEIETYKSLSSIMIPKSIELFGSRKLFEKYYDRVQRDRPSSLKEHKPIIRYATLALFCFIKKQKMTDTLIDLLLKLLKRILTKAERSVDKAILQDHRRVKGKLGTLLCLAKKSIDNPDGVIKDTIYPDITKERLEDIVFDLGEDGQWYRNQVKAKALSLYTHNSRRIVWALMSVLEFETDPQPSLLGRALHFMKGINSDINGKRTKLKDRLFSLILLEKIVPIYWMSLVILKTNHPSKVRLNLNAFELALFEQLSIELPVKNIWVKGAYRYRNPKEDMPHDFDEREQYYFDLLGLTRDENVFIEELKGRLDTALLTFNDSILSNPKVRIVELAKDKKHVFKVTPFEPQIPPQNTERLKLEIAKRWPNLHLIDMLKETDFRIVFTKLFDTVAIREGISEDILRKRLLLCIFGIGSNTGLKHMSGADQASKDQLRYIKRRYMTTANVRAAIQAVVNAIHTIRNPKIWGHGTISCAADSKKISVWDQNLLVEWHSRYGGRGVMIYWHVDKKGLCIHSKLKTCSSSEVSAMLHGVLHHDTDMDIQEISTDTHGQSSIGFAFSEIFGFDLLPRIKNINKQKLYCSSNAAKDNYEHLTGILAPDAINWKKIKMAYLEIVRHTAALKVRSVESDILLKRLSADNKSNVVYQALLEIGKASRTIFLCRYLSSEELRIDINEALNVVERVNGQMKFIFYGRGSEISSNSEKDQELSLLCLHLLHVCMVYINTIVIQTVLSDPKWETLFTSEDWRALSPLFNGHINPYGAVFLDMETRINIENNL